ncbi:hypothetical protein MASR1M101_12350 [Gemmatimonas sp.]
MPLAACLDESPPGDFHPTPAAKPRHAADECPELAGLALDPASVPFIAHIVDRPAPDAHGLPLVLAFRRGATHQEMWWTVPRPLLLEFARDLEQREPERYARWRALVVRGSLPGSRAWDTDGYLAELARLGPPARVYAGMVGYACAAQWTLAKRFQVQPSSKGPTEREFWFARDRRGDLLVRDVTWRLKPFSVWGDAQNYLRVGSTSAWQRLRTTDPVSVEALTEADLPGGEPASLAVSGNGVPAPPTPRRSCRDALALVNDFSQRLTATTPPGVTLVGFQPQREPAATTESWSDAAADRCASVVVELKFEAESRTALAAATDRLRKDAEVRAVELLETSVGERTVRGCVRVVLQ